MVMAVLVALGLLPYKLETGEGTTLYSLKRVLRQKGYDQGVAQLLGTFG